MILQFSLRCLAVAGFLAVFAEIASADLPTPPAPSGKKYVSISNSVQLAVDADVSDYVFVLEHGVGPGPPQYTFRKVKLSSQEPISIPNGGKYEYLSLAAVPVAEAEKFATDDELFRAIEDQKITGRHRLFFGSKATVDITLRGNAVSRKFTITKIDPEKGIVTTVAGEEYDPKKSQPKTGDGSSWDRLRTIFAGCSLAAFAVLGLWVLRQRRVK